MSGCDGGGAGPLRCRSRRCPHRRRRVAQAARRPPRGGHWRQEQRAGLSAQRRRGRSHTRRWDTGWLRSKNRAGRSARRRTMDLHFLIAPPWQGVLGCSCRSHTRRRWDTGWRWRNRAGRSAQLAGRSLCGLSCWLGRWDTWWLRPKNRAEVGHLVAEAEVASGPERSGRSLCGLSCLLLLAWARPRAGPSAQLAASASVSPGCVCVSTICDLWAGDCCLCGLRRLLPLRPRRRRPLHQLHHARRRSTPDGASVWSLLLKIVIGIILGRRPLPLPLRLPLSTIVPAASATCGPPPARRRRRARRPSTMVPAMVPAASAMSTSTW